MHDNERLVRDFFDAFSRDDLETARKLYASDAVLHVDGAPDVAGEYLGFDQLVSFLEQRRERSAGTFGYEVHDFLASDDHAVALLNVHALRDDGQHRWRQVAVYHIRDGQIADIWAHEDPEAF